MGEVLSGLGSGDTLAQQQYVVSGSEGGVFVRSTLRRACDGRLDRPSVSFSAMRKGALR
jgi:hypothetical protein